MENSPLDPLAQAIAGKRASVAAKECAVGADRVALAAKERDLEIEQVELRTLEQAASLRPLKLNGAHHRPVSESGESRNGARGKLPGTVSRHWTEIMQLAVNTGNTFRHHEEWVILAKQAGHEMRPVAVRDWLRRGIGIKQGFIARAKNDFRVTDLGIEKLGLKSARPPWFTATDDVLPENLFAGPAE